MTPKNKKTQKVKPQAKLNEKIIKSSGISRIEVVIFLIIAVLISGGSIYLGSNYDFPIKVSDDDATTVGIITVSLNDQLLAQSEMKKLDDFDEVSEFLDNHREAVDTYYNSRGTDDISFSVEESVGFAAPSILKSANEDYSNTNIQVAGVDESDIIKTDGDYIYAVVKQKVYIIDARPAQDAKIISTITLDGYISDIYINENSLVVFGSESYIGNKSFYEDIRPNSSYTFFKVYNTKDKGDPQLVRDLDFEGNYTNSRMVGDYVYFLTQQSTYDINEDYPIPMVVADEELMPIDSSFYRPDIYYIDVPYQTYSYTSVHAINVKDNDKDITSELYLLGGNENLYVSPNNIYIAYTKYFSEQQLQYEVIKEIVLPGMKSADLAKINDIENSPLHVVSQSEKMSKIGTIINRHISSLTQKEQDAIYDELEESMEKRYEDISKELEKTVIHKISFNKQKLDYKSSGEVTGHVLNQFSMDEYDGNFRIATTKNRNWSSFDFANNESYNNVYVLDDKLKTIGKVENLAEGEQIYSARFMQGRVYLVTFRQVDPLYVIDLKNPTNPTVLGELKVPGFSSYLHPYDETKLIGFGKQATETGSILGLKLSLFDVSDVNNLKEIDTYEMGDSGSDSIALTDHKAFLFSKDKNLLVVPVSLRNEMENEEDSWYNYSYTRGAMAFSVTDEGFEFKARIDHTNDSSDNDEYDYYSGYNYYDSTVKRSLYIGDDLYTFSNKALKINSLDDYSEVKTLTLSNDQQKEETIIIPE
ncbi:beta-propeller domain-containing protein [Patescibacteria group bacterium]|nr:beta-propeller domain-containing protein [Patescibacteria group bacterium]